VQPVAPIEWLSAHGAQRDVIDGLARVATDWETLHRECPRGDWLLGIYVKLGIDRASLLRAAIGCARTSASALEGAIATAAEDVLARAAKVADGEGSSDELAAATRALEAAASGATNPAEEAAARAVLAVGLGAADPDVLPSAPACAAEATIVSTMDCGLSMAMRWAHDACAKAVRAAIAWDQVRSALERA
jgi:hypothetical protein